MHELLQWLQPGLQRQPCSGRGDRQPGRAGTGEQGLEATALGGQREALHGAPVALHPGQLGLNAAVSWSLDFVLAFGESFSYMVLADLSRRLWWPFVEEELLETAACSGGGAPWPSLAFHLWSAEKTGQLGLGDGQLSGLKTFQSPGGCCRDTEMARREELRPPSQHKPWAPPQALSHLPPGYPGVPGRRWAMNRGTGRRSEGTLSSWVYAPRSQQPLWIFVRKGGCKLSKQEVPSLAPSWPCA